MKRIFAIESLESRSLLAALPLGALPTDTGEFLLGTVAVTPVFFQSNGAVDSQTQSWDSGEIDTVLAKINEGVNWWSDMLDSLNTVHSVDFVIDETFATQPVSTPYEGIDRPSSDFENYVGTFLVEQGYGDAGSLENAVLQFNHSQREKFSTDWAFSIFVVDSSDDEDGFFAAGGPFSGAFAYAGGQFVVMPSTRPASTVAHEMGHIFWARDEYPGGGSWTDFRGYYNTQNLNAWNNPTPGFQQEISIMRGGEPLQQAYLNYQSPDSTLAMIGWQDSDGDGVFDLADVPLSLEGVGFFDSVTSIYHFKGHASAVPLLNQNPSGNGSDITLNRITDFQYRLDGGDWQTAATPNAQVAELDISIPTGSAFSQIELRILDAETGITSPVLAGTQTSPASPSSGVTGIVFFDENGNGSRDPGELPLANTSIQISKGDGSPLYFEEVRASDYPEGPIEPNVLPVSVAAEGELFGAQVAIFDTPASGRAFHAFDIQRSNWRDRWSDSVAMTVAFDEPVGQVRVGVFGQQATSYARVEAYDLEGQLIERSTSDALINGEAADLVIASPTGQISSVKIYGHGGTSIGINDFDAGVDGTFSTDSSGVWRRGFIPAGQYRAVYQAEKVIHQYVDSEMTFDVTGDQSLVIQAGAIRVDSPKHNTNQASDVNEDSFVTAFDALLVINDLQRYEPRILTLDDPSSFKVDVNNDGAVSALDALTVINTLARSSGPSGEYVTGDWLHQRTQGAVGPPSSGSKASDYPVEGFAAGGVLERLTANCAVSVIRNESIDSAMVDTQTWVGTLLWANTPENRVPDLNLRWEQLILERFMTSLHGRRHLN